MKGYTADIEKETKKNSNFRKVLFTAPNSQLVVMSLKPGEDIGSEVHEEHDQFIRVEEGSGKAVLGRTEVKIKDDWAVVIPAGVKHNIVNTSKKKMMKLYTIYSPPEHPKGTVHKSKAQALASENH